MNIVRYFLIYGTIGVKISNNHSETQNILSGVPQDSVIESLWFLIFINDLPNHIKSEIKLFVDDVKIFVTLLSKETI